MNKQVYLKVMEVATWALIIFAVGMIAGMVLKAVG